MCVIILRNAGVSIPFEKLQSACIVNPDGWGLAVADRGKLIITKGLSEKTDPEHIAKLLEEAKDQSIMLHLRYVTAGERSLENCHPWLFLEHEKHGIDAAFCHNGTLYTWKESNSNRPDSWFINEKLVKPLYERVVAYTGPKDVLRDEFAQALLEQTAGNTSLFGLIDGNGLQLAINYDNGTEHEGWWSSNDYSFNVSHREPTKTSSYGFGYSRDHYDSMPWEQEVKDQDKGSCKTITEGKIIVPANDPIDVEYEITNDDEDELAENEELLEQGEKIGETLASMKTKRSNPKMVKELLSKTRPTFCEICKIDSLREMTRFDPEDLCELAIFYPEATAVLLKDLLLELYYSGLAKQKRENEEAAKKAA